MIPGKLADEIARMAEVEAAMISDRFDSSLRPRLAQLLIASTEVEIRRSMGQDVALAEQAILTSVANLSLEESGRLRIAASGIAYRAALAVVFRLLTP